MYIFKLITYTETCIQMYMFKLITHTETCIHMHMLVYTRIDT